MLQDQRHVFWEALLVTLFVFALGIFLGYLIELNRVDSIISSYQEAEISLLDIKAQENIFSSENFSCELAVKETIDFADRTYNEALLLEKYGKSARLSEGILYQHKKYDLLRVILWLNAIKIRQNCAGRFHTVVYFFEYSAGDLIVQDQDKMAEQSAFSKYLTELKEKHGDELLLIPIAGNLNINSINFLMESHEIKKLPAILVDEKEKIDDLKNLNNIESYLK